MAVRPTGDALPPDVAAIGARFEGLVAEMYPSMVQARAAMLGGVDLGALAALTHTGEVDGGPQGRVTVGQGPQKAPVEHSV